MVAVLSVCARRVRGVLALMGVLWLGACASTFSAEVSRFQSWPGDTAGSRYHIVTQDSEKNNLQFQSYADIVRAAIGVTGLVEARQPTEARFDVFLNYSSPVTRTWVQRPVDPFYYPGGPFGFHGPYMGMGHPWGGWAFGPPMENVPVTLYQHTLTIRIQDRSRQGQEVYRATAVSLGRSGNLTAAMPYLARAIFDRFPGHNGEVIEIEYPLAD